MQCFYPLLGYRSKTVNPSGKRSIVFTPHEGFSDLPVTLPCGRCIGCRLERSRLWAMRCVHEASLHDENCFLTLTYNDQHLPASGSLIKTEVPLFMKRLRKSLEPLKVRFFHCGEYGFKGSRPHYHALIFGYAFPDRVLFSQKNGVDLYVSDSLNRLWGKGFCTVGDLTFESAAYVARYVLKKVTGPDAEDVYQGREPEFVTMSRRPGIGAGWIDKFASDVYPSDRVVLRGGAQCRPARFYDNKFDIDNPSVFSDVKRHRLQNVVSEGSERLRAKEECTRLRVERLVRNYEA